jgi:hypothetical protein
MIYFFTYSFFDTKIWSNLTQKKVSKLVEFTLRKKKVQNVPNFFLLKNGESLLKEKKQQTHYVIESPSSRGINNVKSVHTMEGQIFLGGGFAKGKMFSFTYIFLTSSLSFSS